MSTKPRSSGPNDKSRVLAKVRYKNRTLYVVAETKDGLKCLVTDLDCVYHRWVDKSECELIKVYKGREVRSRYGRGISTYTEYQTLGDLRRFRDRQRELSKTLGNGSIKCSSCGLCITETEGVEDLEDGLLKCYRCCDIPSY